MCFIVGRPWSYNKGGGGGGVVVVVVGDVGYHRSRSVVGRSVLFIWCRVVCVGVGVRYRWEGKVERYRLHRVDQGRALIGN